MPTEPACHACEFSPTDPCKDIDKYEQISMDGHCPHIKKVEPKFNSVGFCALMDSNCHAIQPGLNSICQRQESTILRLVANKESKKTMAGPQAITCRLTSFRQDLLRFVGGQTTGVFSVLDLKDKPLWIYPYYRKAGLPNCAASSVLVEKYPEHELRFVPVEVEVSIWKKYPEASFSAQRIGLSVAIPPNSASTASARQKEQKGEITVDPLSVITLVSSGLKLVDQFRELAIRFLGKAPTPPSGRAEQVGTALEVRQGNQVTQKVEANQIRMDQWDTPRYDALYKRIQTNWTIYNDLFTSEAGASALEGARIRADMRNTQNTLCNDFREMVRLYERALGISLPDHYQLFEVCQP
jgi:hypothetical protein